MLNNIFTQERLSIAVGAALFASISVPSVKGEVQSGFKLNCQSWFLQGTIFSAFCSQPGGGFGAESQLDLNRCLANINGVLVCAQNGSYSQFCQNCVVASPPSSVLSCGCQEANNGPFVQASFDLNNCVSDINGVIACP